MEDVEWLSLILYGFFLLFEVLSASSL